MTLSNALLTHRSYVSYAHKSLQKRQPTSVKLASGKDLFFKGDDKSSTHYAAKQVEKGETAGSVLALILKNDEFEGTVLRSVSTGLDNVLPYVGFATKAPKAVEYVNAIRTRNYEERVTRGLDRFFKNPSENTLRQWQAAENARQWGFLTPAHDLYTSIIDRIQQAADHLVGSPAPSLLDQDDLRRGISKKNTAIGSMFLFNDNNIEYWAEDSYSQSPGSGRVRDVHTYGQVMLRRKFDERFDLMTALKVGDLYKKAFSKKQLTHFYNGLCDLMLAEYQVSQGKKYDKVLYRTQMKLLQEHLKDAIAHNYIDPKQSFPSVLRGNGSSSRWQDSRSYCYPISEVLTFDADNWDRAEDTPRHKKPSTSGPAHINNIEIAHKIDRVIEKCVVS